MALIHWITVITFTSLYLEAMSQKSDKYVKAVNCFSMDLMKKLKTEDGNLIMSGLSADIALSMLAMGALGPTAVELSLTLRNKENELNNEDIRRESRAAMQRLTSNQNVTLNLANAMYVDQKFPLNPDYKKTVEESFLAKAENVDFKNKAHEATEAINSWVSEKTKKLIEKLFERDLDPLTVLVLLNAIYFKGDWLHKFNPADTKKREFFNGGDTNSPKMVDLMNQKRKFAYKDDSNLKAQVLKMNYKGEKISFVAVLPHKGLKMEDFVKGMSCQTVSGFRDMTGKSLVNVFLPKLDKSSDLKLVQPLRDLGTNLIFDGGDLSAIGPGGLRVTEVLQKARIKINEDGSEAAAATGVVVAPPTVLEPPKEVEFLANRPYLFFIIENESGLILFQGKVNTF